ncbi:3-oxoadipate CoA-transferase subunit A [bacterium HR10]|nr:3-oxoadipate CoA-transferase subunit A [bacterium HR10]
MTNRMEKILTLAEAVRQIEDGSTIALGGLSYFNAPMALVRELIRQRKRGLTVITSAVTSLQADLLIAAGCVRRLISPYVGLEELGMAPNFRRAAERGEIEICEIGEAFLAFGLKAGAAGAPFFPLPRALAHTDLVRVNTDYRFTRDPFTGEEVLCVPALVPDWALLHAQQSDPFGNARHLGSAYMDLLLARAARRCIVSCDEVIPQEAVRAEPQRTTLPAVLVDHVIPLFGSAHPTASEPLYDVDREHLRLYLELSRTPEGAAQYLQEFVRSSDESAYLQKVRGTARVSTSRVESAECAPEEAPPSVGELLAVIFSRLVEDGDIVGVGTGCVEVAAGLRLAQLTHAPNLSFIMGGTGALNPDAEELPPSVNSARAISRAEAVLRLEDLFDLELRGDLDVMFLSGLQIDRHGNVNLVGVGPWSAPRLRGPGSVGLELAPHARRRVAFFRRHTRQVFVERVDFISAPGYVPKVIEDGAYWVVTDLAVMDFDDEGRMRLVSLHPGVTVEQVRERTGFELLIPTLVPTTPPPTREELQLLRTRVDRRGLLRAHG